MKRLFMVLLAVQLVAMVGCSKSEDKTSPSSSTQSVSNDSNDSNDSGSGNNGGSNQVPNLDATSQANLNEIYTKIKNRDFKAEVASANYHRYIFKQSTPVVEVDDCLAIFVCTSIDNEASDFYTIHTYKDLGGNTANDRTLFDYENNVAINERDVQSLENIYSKLDSYVDSQDIRQVIKIYRWDAYYGNVFYYQIVYSNGNYVIITADRSVYGALATQAFRVLEQHNGRQVYTYRYIYLYQEIHNRVYSKPAIFN